MKYKFTTKFKQNVTIDRALLGGKIKVYAEDRLVAPSHRGERGATGTFYPLKGGTLEVRSSMFEVVPRAWFNDDWLDLVPPLTTWQYALIALPLVGAFMISFGQILGLVVGALASLLSYVVMQSQRPVKARAIICIIITALTPLVVLAVTIGVNALLGAGQ